MGARKSSGPLVSPPREQRYRDSQVCCCCWPVVVRC